MKNNSYPLFTNWSNYEKWLPVRSITVGATDLGCKKLYTLPHWIKRKDLDFVVDKLLRKPLYRKGVRKLVRYLSVPSGYGKTSLILPAFLRSTELEDGFTHYIYIAFANNDSRNFHADPFAPSSDIKKAEEQGAFFIVECVNTILADKNSKPGSKFKIDIRKTSDKTPEQELEEIITNLSNGDRQAKILFHVDEHRKM